jgi:hypothetical protein
MKDDILVATSGMPKPQSTPIIEFTPNMNGKVLLWSNSMLCSRPPTSVSYKKYEILMNYLKGLLQTYLTAVWYKKYWLSYTKLIFHNAYSDV